MDVDLRRIQAARARIAGRVHRTPVLHSRTFSDLAGVPVILKAENLQRTGSFKIRGASNKIMQLSPDAKARGVVCASAGNHAQGVALAAQLEGIAATVVMPEGASISKAEATRGYGARVELWGEAYDHAYERAREIQRETGATFVHAYEDPEVIAGQGTIGLEILEDVPDVAAVVVPVGGGGLISGIAIALKAQNPGIRVFGVQPLGAPSMLRAREAGRPVALDAIRTIADGLALKAATPAMLALVGRWVDDVVGVAEDEIARAILLLLERKKLVAEGAGAAALAAVLHRKVPPAGGKTVVLVSGGNIDVGALARIIDRGMAAEGRVIHLRTRLLDRPGALRAFLELIAAHRANVIAIHHDRLRADVGVGEAEVELVVETRHQAHGQELIDTIRQAGYPVALD